MSIEIRAYSRKLLMVVGTLELEDSVELDSKKAEIFVKGLEQYQNDKFNLEIRFEGHPVHQMLEITYNEIHKLVEEMVITLGKALDWGAMCGSCQVILKFVLRTEDVVEIILESLQMKVKAQGIYEAKCPNCGQRYMKFEKIVEMATV